MSQEKVQGAEEDLSRQSSLVVEDDAANSEMVDNNFLLVICPIYYLINFLEESIST